MSSLKSLNMSSTPPIDIDIPEPSDNESEVEESEEDSEYEDETPTEDSPEPKKAEQFEAESEPEVESSPEPVKEISSRSRSIRKALAESSESDEVPEVQLPETRGRKKGTAVGKYSKDRYALEIIVSRKGGEMELELVGKYPTIQGVADKLGLTYSKTYRIWRKQDKLSKKFLISKIEEKISLI